MAIIGTAPFPERIRFFDGQRLFAADLQALEQFNREMRWLHNQSLHQAGVASGYAVVGNRDDRQVTIQPGYAIDAAGREIVLTQPEILQVPPVATDGQGNPVYFDLTVLYPDDSLLKETETRDGICVPRGAVRLREKPVFCWVELVSTSDPPGPGALATDRQAKLAAVNKQVESGMRIRLARAEVFNCKLNQALSVAQRRNARTSASPFLAAGRTSPTDNTWEITTSARGILATLKVHTADSQFRTTPRYIARAGGDRELKVTVQAKTLDLVLDGFPRVDEPSATGFTFSLLIPSILLDLTGITMAEVAAALQPALKSWYVEWLGIEG
jgi:hypothetical protein